MIPWDILGTNLSSREFDDVFFKMGDDVRSQHVYILGRTGTGKSNLLARLVLSDIERGDGLLVLDPHGDLVEDIIDHCPANQLDRVIYWDPSDREYPVPMNIFECRPGQDLDTVCSEVIGIFKRLYGDSWGPLLEDLLRSLTLTMIDHQFLGVVAVDEAHRYNATLKEAHDVLYDGVVRRGYYPFIQNDMVRTYWTHFYDVLGRGRGDGNASLAQVRHASSTGNKIRRFLLNPLIFDIVANRNTPSSFDLRQIMDTQKVLLVNLSKGRLGEDNSALLGSIVLSRLVVAALSRSDLPRRERQRNRFHVVADEFQAFATDSFGVLLSEARKYGVSVTLAHQHRAQLEPEMQSAALNCGSIISFRTIGRDAADVAREFDFTPPESGHRFEPVMKPQHHWDHEGMPEDVPLGAPWERVGAHDSKLRELLERRQELLQRRRALMTRQSAIVGDSWRRERAERGDRSWKAKAQIGESDFEKYAHELVNKIAPEIVEVGKAIAEVESRILRAFPHIAQELQIPGDTYHRTDNFLMVPTKESYAEREREIANQLTQLPNFQALARDSNGRQCQVYFVPLPDETDGRDARITMLRQRTRDRYAIRPADRASLRQNAYLERLRREEAEEYEAELDEQPEPLP